MALSTPLSARAIALLLVAGLVSCSTASESNTPSNAADNAPPATTETTTTEADSQADQATGTSASSNTSSSNTSSTSSSNASSSSTSGTNTSSTNTATKAETANAPALSPGRYCYFGKDEVNTLNARITVEANQEVNGNFQGTIADASNGYYTSYRQDLNGTITGSNLALDVTSWIEYDRQSKQETWRVSPTELRTGRNTLKSADCATVDPAFQNTVGQDGDRLTENYENVRTESVQFAPGESGITLSNAVVRGEAFVYTLVAQGGQRMSLSIRSIEDNAMFDVVSPSGIAMEREDPFSAEFILPETGTYKVIVSGSRGNATYDLVVDIE